MEITEQTQLILLVLETEFKPLVLLMLRMYVKFSKDILYKTQTHTHILFNNLLFLLIQASIKHSKIHNIMNKTHLVKRKTKLKMVRMQD